jgi:predicted alpha/beta superfamily hydrolase
MKLGQLSRIKDQIMRIVFPIVAFLLISQLMVAAQETAKEAKPFILGHIDSIKSVHWQQARMLNIYLPPGYEEDSIIQYPVIYLLDGSADEDFIHIAGLIQFLNFPWVNVLPKSILVGIANQDRRRDFTFPTKNKKDKAASPSSGGSANFIDFIEKELQPYIESHYRVKAPKTIIGESLGGLLATEILFSKPALFDQYIIVSPSLWWDDESLLKSNLSFPSGRSFSEMKVYVSAGNEGAQMARDVSQFMEILKKAQSRGLKSYYVGFPNETHATIFHRSVYKAFEILNAKSK